jgi:glycosyltransferase involved in cell wall biosynthesis
MLSENLQSSPKSPPLVTVIMAVHNGADFIHHSICSVLAQTMPRFELIVIDDCSSDDTCLIVNSFKDDRIHLIRNEHNLGVVGARNRGISAAVAPFICVLDHDDLIYPTKFRAQIDYLINNADIMLVGTSSGIMSGNMLVSTRQPAHFDPLFVRWELNNSNQIVHSSIMFRREVVQKLGEYLRSEYAYAEDFDFYHRVLSIGTIGCLKDRLTIYRRHGNNISLKRENEMIAATARILEFSYKPFFGDDAKLAARAIAFHITAQKPVLSIDSLLHLGNVLARLRQAFIETYRPDAEIQALIDADAGFQWWQVVQRAMLFGLSGALDCYGKVSSLAVLYRPSPLAIAAAHLNGAWIIRTLKATTRKYIKSIDAGHQPQLRRDKTRTSIFGLNLRTMAIDDNIPPTLYVVVDTEAEFDWTKPFSRSMTSVHNISEQISAQRIFDQYGIRPIYVVDYPVASCPKASAILKEFLSRGACEIGIHLHPWTCPPFTEELNEFNSYPGNLPAALEEQKIANLVDAVRANFGISPKFYKAGRYGFGPNSAIILQKYAIAVDFSLLPETDMRARGGPDCRYVRTNPYRCDNGLVFLPMTRAHTGLLWRLGPLIGPCLQSIGPPGVMIRGMLSRMGIMDCITLTPEGVSLSENIRLIETLMRRGYRNFVMHYHSSSLTIGRTPYAQDENARSQVLSAIESICRYFVGIGGLPGNPADLVYFSESREPAREIWTGR